MKIIFETSRLIIRKLRLEDESHFFAIMGDPEVRQPVPRRALTQQESLDQLKEFMEKDQEDSPVRVWGITEKGVLNPMVGICGFLTNDEDEKELAYNLAKEFWGKGYGTETARGLLEYGFGKLGAPKLTADVQIANTRSSSILHKFMKPQKVFFNEKDHCQDERYAISKEEWILLKKNL